MARKSCLHDHKQTQTADKLVHANLEHDLAHARAAIVGHSQEASKPQQHFVGSLCGSVHGVA